MRQLRVERQPRKRAEAETHPCGDVHPRINDCLTVRRIEGATPSLNESLKMDHLFDTRLIRYFFDILANNPLLCFPFCLSPRLQLQTHFHGPVRRIFITICFPPFARQLVCPFSSPHSNCVAIIQAHPASIDSSLYVLIVATTS